MHGALDGGAGRRRRCRGHGCGGRAGGAGGQVGQGGGRRAGPEGGGGLRACGGRRCEALSTRGRAGGLVGPLLDIAAPGGRDDRTGRGAVGRGGRDRREPVGGPGVHLQGPAREQGARPLDGGDERRCGALPRARPGADVPDADRRRRSGRGGGGTGCGRTRGRTDTRRRTGGSAPAVRRALYGRGPSGCGRGGRGGRAHRHRGRRARGGRCARGRGGGLRGRAAR